MPKVPVVFITDPGYVFPTRIAIRSLLRHREETTDYAIQVLGVGLSEADCAALRREDPTLQVREVPNRYRELCRAYTHVSTAALCKFDLPQLLPEYDRVIYLDSDVLVLDDLSELYASELGDRYAGMVPEFRGMALLKLHEPLKLRTYCNSGVMLANLARWRKEDLSAKLFDLKTRERFNGFMDQDVFNVMFGDQVLALPLKYNFTAAQWWGSPGVLENFYSGEELATVQAARDGRIEPGRIAVLHYFMKSKPWKSLRNDRAMRYWWRFLTWPEAFSLRTGLLIRKLRRLGGL